MSLSETKPSRTKKKVARKPLMVEIAAALNRCSAENGSDSPDYILADYLLGCLRAFDRATQQRDKWHGFDRANVWKAS